MIIKNFISLLDEPHIAAKKSKVQLPTLMVLSNLIVIINLVFLIFYLYIPVLQMNLFKILNRNMKVKVMAN